MITNLFVNKGDTSPDTDLIYMKPLHTVLYKVLGWYFDPGKKILDVTSGERRCWGQAHETKNLFTDEKSWNVTFTDQSPNAKAVINCDFRELPFDDNSFDIIFFDPPFFKLSNAIEAIRIKTNHKPNRHFYFRQDEWIPPEDHFKKTWKEFNRVSRNGLIVKMSERYENGYEVPVYTEMDLNYYNKYNAESKFKRCGRISYRGRRPGLGMKSIHPQRVLSSYTVFKKDYKIR